MMVKDTLDERIDAQRTNTYSNTRVSGLAMHPDVWHVLSPADNTLEWRAANERHFAQIAEEDLEKGLPEWMRRWPFVGDAWL